ncbi:hypothetical protein [Streptomyces sp. NBC_00310]|uniref:hypothetical protein n=1 Tax=Streptomyces sp. NBC_00310 TaxID=2903645 RepID=UPI002E2120BF
MPWRIARRRRATTTLLRLGRFLSAHEHVGVLDSPLEDLVGELAVDSTRALDSCSVPTITDEEPDGLAASGLRIRRRQAGGDLVHGGRRALGVRLLGGVRAAADLVEQCGGGASGAGLVTVLG